MERNKKIKIEKWAIAVMLIIGVLFYFVPGEWISMQSDSLPYLEARGRQGILPGYPVFLSFFRSFMGEQNFLNGVVIAQSILAIVCTFSFVMVLQNQFQLKGWECILLYIATMLPFSIYLPESGITHQIMTEGITYALFYLYFIAVLKAIWTLRLRWYGGSLIMAYILGLIRTQMLFLQAVSFLVLLWVIYSKCKCIFWKKIVVLIVTTFVGILVAFSSYKLIYAVVEFDNQRLIEKAQKEELAGVTKSTEEKTYISPVGEEKVPAQFDSVIISRGFFEAEKEDVSLFKDEMMQQIFLRTYELANQSEHLYQYAKPGLYMWEDLVYDRMADFANQAIREYDEKNPGIRTRSSASIIRELGIRVLGEHIGRYFYHVFRLMLPSFIASVFFQIKPIYLLCHFIALFLYLFAIVGAFWVGKKGENRNLREYVLSIVLVIVVMNVVLNLVFIGLQRYVVYGMGIFYCSMYLQLKEIVKIVLTKRGVKRV